MDRINSRKALIEGPLETQEKPKDRPKSLAEQALESRDNRENFLRDLIKFVSDRGGRVIESEPEIMEPTGQGLTRIVSIKVLFMETNL